MSQGKKPQVPLKTSKNCQKNFTQFVIIFKKKNKKQKEQAQTS